MRTRLPDHQGAGDRVRDPISISHGLLLHAP